MLTGQMRVAVLCSRRAPGLTHLLARSRQERRDCPWHVVCCLTSEPAFDEQPVVAAYGLPIIHHPVRRFYAERDPQARLGNLAIRAEYDRTTAALLDAHRPDWILLAGYLLLLTRPMLTAFPNRIANVHHADLLLRNPSGGPRYPGLRAVRDAILAGEPETRCTSHIVTERLDDGPVLVQSRPYPVPVLVRQARSAGAGADDAVRRLIRAHQEWLLRHAFGPLMEASLDLLCEADPSTRSRLEAAL